MSHQLETIIGYKFKNPELLEIALTHTSYANESRTPVKHNERLEFLGDSVLQIVSADYLFHAYADRPEGDLTRIRASLVSEGALFQFAQEIDLGEYLRLGRGEERCGGRTRPSVVSDAFEAVIAALYLDGGMEVAKSFILPFITEGKHAEADYKTRLQEIVQQNPEERLSYVVEQESGPDHDKHFVVAVRFNSDKVARGEGRSKKMAEQHAARKADQFSHMFVTHRFIPSFPYLSKHTLSHPLFVVIAGPERHDCARHHGPCPKPVLFHASPPFLFWANKLA